MKNEELLLHGKITKTFISYLIPTILGMLTNSIYCLVDVYFVGAYLGADGLAAFNIAMPIFTIFSSIGLSLGIGGATTISVLIGQNDRENVNKVFSFTALASATLGIIMSICGTVFLEPFARLLGATDELLPGVMQYLFPLQLVAVIYILNCTFQVLIRADFNPKLVMIAAIAGNGTNILFDWLFVGVFNWGLIGASTATALGPVVAVSILVFHYILKKNTFHFTNPKISKEFIFRILKNGLATFILEFSSGSIVYLFNSVLLKVSTAASVAVYAVISNIAYVGKGIFNGISQAAQPLISVNYGAGNFDRMKKATRVAVIASIIFSASIFLLILIFPRAIVGAFVGTDTYLIEPGVIASQIYFISFIFTGVNTVLMYYFQSSENSKLATLISGLRGIVFVIIGLLIFSPIFKDTGVWITLTFAEVLTLLVCIPLKRHADKFMRSKFNS